MPNEFSVRKKWLESYPLVGGGGEIGRSLLDFFLVFVAVFFFFGQIAITRILFVSICDNTYTKSIRVIAKSGQKSVRVIAKSGRKSIRVIAKSGQKNVRVFSF